MAVQQINKATFEQLVHHGDKPVLVDFFATWCGPCKAFAPTLEAVAQAYEGRVDVVKVDCLLYTSVIQIEIPINGIRLAVCQFDLCICLGIQSIYALVVVFLCIKIAIRVAVELYDEAQINIIPTGVAVDKRRVGSLRRRIRAAGAEKKTGHKQKRNETKEFLFWHACPPNYIILMCFAKTGPHGCSASADEALRCV